jgi:hypothetical protein
MSFHEVSDGCACSSRLCVGLQILATALWLVRPFCVLLSSHDGALRAAVCPDAPSCIGGARHRTRRLRHPTCMLMSCKVESSDCHQKGHSPLCTDLRNVRGVKTLQSQFAQLARLSRIRCWNHSVPQCAVNLHSDISTSTKPSSCHFVFLLGLYVLHACAASSPSSHRDRLARILPSGFGTTRRTCHDDETPTVIWPPVRVRCAAHTLPACSARSSSAGLLRACGGHQNVAAIVSLVVSLPCSARLVCHTVHIVHASW